MKITDPPRRQLKGRQRLGITPGDHAIDLLFGNSQGLGRQRRAVETPGIFDQRRIATGANIGDDGGDGGVDIGRMFALGREQRRELLGEAGRCAVKPPRHASPPGSG